MAYSGKRFNINGICYPHKHYMVNLASRLKEIKKLVEDGEYIVINRARQYGKSTILTALREYLRDEYIVIQLSFERFSTAKFRNEQVFSAAFAKEMVLYVENKRKKVSGLDAQEICALKEALSRDTEAFDLVELFSHLSALCISAQKPVVLLIDEVDQASDNQIFLDFLSQLRNFYLDREDTPTFQSVILAGVYDVKNLKHKIRPEEDQRYNSPWNISCPFEGDMSFSAGEIAVMLEEYAQESQMEMDVTFMAQKIYDYTEGYPFLVSYLCKKMDEGQCQWDCQSLQNVVRQMPQTTNSLFDDIIKNLENRPDFRQIVESILIQGNEVAYVLSNPYIALGVMFGIFQNKDGRVRVANYIFEMCIYEYLISVSQTQNMGLADYADKS